MNISDKIFAVSGAASGLGERVARMIVENGGRVIGLDINEEWVNIRDEDERIRRCRCDVRSESEVGESLQNGQEYFGRLDGAIACAGISPARTLFSGRKGSHPLELFSKVLEINLIGTFNLFNLSTPLILKNRKNEDEEIGVLVATSSIAATEGQVGQVAYSASKGGVSGMILPMSREFSRYGIRVNAIAPGIFETPMVKAFPEEVQTSLAAQIPFPSRLGDPVEFAMLVRHIIENTYLNGTIIRLDGGVRMI